MCKLIFFYYKIIHLICKDRETYFFPIMHASSLVHILLGQYDI